MFSLIFLFQSVLPPIPLFLSPNLLYHFPCLILLLFFNHFSFRRFLMSFLNATFFLSINLLSQWQAFFSIHSYFLSLSFFKTLSDLFSYSCAVGFVFRQIFFIYACSPKRFSVNADIHIPAFVGHSWLLKTTQLYNGHGYVYSYLRIKYVHTPWM